MLPASHLASRLLIQSLQAISRASLSSSSSSSSFSPLNLLHPRLRTLLPNSRRTMSTDSSTPSYYSGNPLNRLSYLRSCSSFLSSALSSPKSRFLLLHNLNPLCNPPSRENGGAITLHTLSWEEIKESIGCDADEAFAFVDDKASKAIDAVPATEDQEAAKRASVQRPALVFLGVDERSAPESAKSLPLSKPTDESTLEGHSPYGVPYFALDVSDLEALRKKVAPGGNAVESFVDMRAGMASIPHEEAALAGEARSLIDWNKRNVFCPACGRQTRSLWAGWKRTCLDDKASPCSSKKGIQNFNYPRTDPVVIMAVLDPTREKILLGRQKMWPSKFYSCLAGFIESGETIEEAVRREVYEEAGIEVGEVFYHSTQPWPYPSSLMIGMICVAKENQTIRCDLDNELEDAKYFTRESVLNVLNSGIKPTMSREEVARIDGKEGALGRARSRSRSDPQARLEFRMPPSTAIAHSLISAWAHGNAFSQGAGGKL